MSVKVAVRVRPFNSREMDLGCRCCVDMDENGRTSLIDFNAGEKKRDFTFDFSFWSHDGFRTEPNGLMVTEDPKYCDQKYVYDRVGSEVLSNAWEGYHTCLFAYGQTGAGKSYSMLGYGPNKGIVPITCEEIFKKIAKNDNPKKSYEVFFSMLEIYNEKIQDLLIDVNQRPTGGLKVRENKTHGVFVEGLSKWPVHSYNQIEEKMELGNKHRSVASTMMNSSSSRAHTIITIEFKQITQEEKRKGEKLSVINLVDLAGSEKIAKTGASGDRLKEGCSINLSLTILGVVISKLADISTGKGKGVVVPYRDSALTRILQNALGGNSKTLMICAISPATDNYEETLSTLRYADQAKKIKNHAVVNESETDKMIRKLKEENDKLRNFLENFASTGGSLPPNILESFGIHAPSTPKEEESMNEPIDLGGAQAQRTRRGSKTVKVEEDEMAKRIVELEEQLQANAILMKEYETSYDDKVSTMKDKEESIDKEDLTAPHITNLNEDPLLNGKVYYNLNQTTTLRIGKKNGDPKPDIVLSALGIQPNHATITNEEGKFFLEPVSKICGDHLFLNGDKIFEKTELYHLDRILIGTSTVLLFKNPGKAEQKREFTVNENEIDWETAQMEIALKTEKIKKIEEAKMEKEMEIQQAEKIKKLEQEFKEQQEEKERRIKKEYEERIMEIQREHEEQQQEMMTMEIENEFNDALQKVESERVQKELEMERKKKEIMEEAVIAKYKEREKHFFESKLAKALPMITEVNLMAKELKRNVFFSIKLAYSYNESFDLQHFGEQHKKTKIQIKVLNKDFNCEFLWPMKTFQNRYFIIKDLLDAYFETNTIPAIDLDNDPFWDPPTPRVIGMGLLKLMPICYFLDHPCELVLVGDSGQVGTLSANLIPCDDKGTVIDPNQAEFVDDPMELIGRDIHFYVSLNEATLPTFSCKNTFLEYQLMKNKKETESYKSETIVGIENKPNYNYMKMHSLLSVNQHLINYLLNHNLTIKVMGFDNDANLELPKELFESADQKEEEVVPLPEEPRPPSFKVSAFKPTLKDVPLDMDALMENPPERIRTCTLPPPKVTKIIENKTQRAQDDHPLGQRSQQEAANNKKKKDDCNVF